LPSTEDRKCKTITLLTVLRTGEEAGTITSKHAAEDMFGVEQTK